MSLGFAYPHRPGVGDRASLVLRRMPGYISDAPLVWVALAWRLDHSGDRTDPVGAGVNGRIKQ